MKRLQDSPADTPLMREVQRVLDAAPPTPEDTVRMARVRRALDRAPSAARPLRGFAIAVAVTLVATSAFAAVRWATDVFSEATPDTTRNSPPPSRSAQASAPAPSVGEGEELGETTTTSAESDRPRSPARVRSKASPQVAPAAHDSELVHRALTALRRDHDAALAARLLKEQRKLYPDGPLAEEALSLQIEAAVVLGDRNAKLLAKQYMSRYPGGRYAEIAKRALGESPR